jgi:hypothetical protein
LKKTHATTQLARRRSLTRLRAATLLVLPALGTCGGQAPVPPTMASSSPSTAAAGPLVVSKVNPRYFTLRSGDPAGGRAVFLTGSHINNNFQDGAGPGPDCASTPENSDFDSYLHFLVDHGHNFIRLWRWEHFKSQLGGGQFHMCMSPQPWPRTGSGSASDGKPRFDLSRFDPAYFDRLRRSVIAAGDRGIYVSVMLFEGHALHLTAPPDNVEGHPFHARNNVNQIGIRSIVDYQVLPLDPRVQALQEAYIRKIIDTVHDLPNVLYEVANESSGDTGDSVRLPDGTTIATPIGDSTEWQYRVIDFVKQYEQQKGYDKHPIGMTMQYPVPDQRKVNAPLFNSHADWISPGFDEIAATAKKGDGPAPGRWLLDPPPNDGTKVILSDTDHYSPFHYEPLWAWKSLLRGHNPVLYDFGIVTGVNAPSPPPGFPPYQAYEPTRHAMGDALRYARKVKLLEMVPSGDLSSTGYALAHPGQEYLVLQPSKDSTSFTLKLTAGTYAVAWYDVDTRNEVERERLSVVSPTTVTFDAPFAPAVLYLKRAVP